MPTAPGCSSGTDNGTYLHLERRRGITEKVKPLRLFCALAMARAARLITKEAKRQTQITLHNGGMCRFFRIFALNKLRFATGKPAGLAFVANIPKLKTMTIKTKLQTLIAAMMATTAMSAQQQACFNYFRYSGNDTRFDRPIDRTRQYFNPILAGFYPDPSVCRKGDTYYMVNSSFGFFPGVPLFTSQDLVNWKQAGHVLDRPGQLPLGGQGVSGGIFAPSIAYNEHNNTFYMITTNVGRGNFFVKSANPEEGWSDPIWLPTVGGIDPSFFFDEDGSAYIVNNDEPRGGSGYDGERSIMLHKFCVEGDSTTGEQLEIIRSGSHVEQKPIWIEGPHLYRIGKYYYLMCAEGGTGARHSEVVFRARHPEGPWEEYAEGNPILTQRDGLDPLRPDPVTSAGHADLVQTPEGQWYAVFLGCRPYEADMYNTGRDTYLLPVTWSDGWPTILKAGKAIETVIDNPGLQPGGDLLTGNFTYTDSFRQARLHHRWIMLRNPTDFYATGTTRGLAITPKPVNISQRQSPAAVFARQQHTDFTAETELTFEPKSEKDLAGMVLLQNEDYNIVMGKTMVDGRPAITLTRTEKGSARVATAMLTGPEAASPLRLRICGRGRYYDFDYSADGRQWQTLARGVDASCLSTAIAGGFTGTCIGLYATSAN